MSAYNRRPTQEALSKCKQLWNAIVVAPGFTKNFAFWICTNFKMFVPRNLPHIEYVLELKNTFRRWHQSELNKFFLLKVKNRKKSVLLDIAKGGSKCFEEIRDPAPLHQSFVVQNLSLQVRYTAWPKKGKRQIYVYGADQLDVNFPVRFQGQECNIVKIEGGNVTLNKPLRLKNLQLLLEQQQITADPKEMHERTFKAWNEHWQRDCKDPNDDDWDDVIPYLQHVNPVPEMPFEDFSMQLWDKHVKAVKPKTARGGCGFSAKEMLNFPPAILEWLFEIYRFCERRSSWPKTGFLPGYLCWLKRHIPQHHLTLDQSRYFLSCTDSGLGYAVSKSCSIWPHICLVKCQWLHAGCQPTSQLHTLPLMLKTPSMTTNSWLVWALI